MFFNIKIIFKPWNSFQQHFTTRIPGLMCLLSKLQLIKKRHIRNYVWNDEYKISNGNEECYALFWKENRWETRVVRVGSMAACCFPLRGFHVKYYLCFSFIPCPSHWLTVSFTDSVRNLGGGGNVVVCLWKCPTLQRVRPAQWSSYR